MFNLAVRRGEIVGIAGVAGNGQQALAEVITGLRPLQRGTLLVAGENRTGARATQLARAGVGHIPEDRLGMGLFSSLSVLHNAILRAYHAPPVRRGLRLVRDAAAAYTTRLLQQADVHVPYLDTPVSNLSGGNQQKLLVHREMATATHLLVAVHPTRGLDVAATAEVQRALVRHRNNDVAVLLISEDLEEILALADRIAVMYEGRLVGPFPRQVSREDIGLRMGGCITPEERHAEA